MNSYNHIWLPIELGFMLNLFMKSNEEELIYQLEGWVYLYNFWKTVQNVTIESYEEIYSGMYPPPPPPPSLLRALMLYLFLSYVSILQ